MAPGFRSTKNQRVDALAAVALFSGCSKQELATIAGLVEDVRVDAGHVLMKEGTSGSECFVIVSGFAAATKEGRAIGDLAPGAVFGEMALIDRAPRFATVTATTSMQLLLLRGDAFWKVLDSSPAVTRKVVRQLAQRVRSAEKATAPPELY